MTEQFAFQKTFGNGPAIDRDKWLVPADTVLMDHVGHQFFAGAALALDQNRGTAGADAIDYLIELLHFRAFADQLIKAEAVFESLLDLNIFNQQLSFFNDAFNQNLESLKIDGLLKVVVPA